MPEVVDADACTVQEVIAAVHRAMRKRHERQLAFFLTVIFVNQLTYVEWPEA